MGKRKQPQPPEILRKGHAHKPRVRQLEEEDADWQIEEGIEEYERRAVQSDDDLSVCRFCGQEWPYYCLCPYFEEED